MAIEKTEAIVLRTVNYRDTSKVVTFYTKRHGKMSAIAKGVRNPKNKFGSLLQPLNYLQIVFYRRENRDLQYVSSSEFVRYFKTLTSDMTKFAIAMSLLEIINRVMHDEEENEQIFGLLVDSLIALDAKETLPLNVFAYFGLHLASGLGFEPAFSRCLLCGNSIDLEKEKEVAYVIEKGSPICEKCAANIGQSYVLSASALRILHNFVRLTAEAASKSSIEPSLQRELSNFVFVYLRRHSDTLREIKSLKFLAAAQYTTGPAQDSIEEADGASRHVLE